MIFVTVGMHHQGFDRLIAAMDDVAANTDERIVMQIGSASYEPARAEWFRFADGAKVDSLIASARVVVAHAGAGTIIGAFRHQRPLVVVPRRFEHGEHVDDHQIDLAQALASEGKVSLVLEPTVDTLLEGFTQAEHLRPHTKNNQKLAAAVSGILSGKTAVENEDNAQLNESRKTGISA